jgi:hypothetical protein
MTICPSPVSATLRVLVRGDESPAGGVNIHLIVPTLKSDRDEPVRGLEHPVICVRERMPGDARPMAS